MNENFCFFRDFGVQKNKETDLSEFIIKEGVSRCEMPFFYYSLIVIVLEI